MKGKGREGAFFCCISDDSVGGEVLEGDGEDRWEE